MLYRKSLLLLSLIALPGVPSFGASPPSPPSHWTDGYVMANGIRIHYWRTGGGKPPMVLADGSSDDVLCWTNLAKELEDSFDIILFDARGHGLSDPPSASDPADAQGELRQQNEEIASLLKNGKLVHIEGAGHNVRRDQKQRTLDALRPFLAVYSTKSN